MNQAEVERLVAFLKDTSFMNRRDFYIEIGGVNWFIMGGGYPEENHFLLAQPVEAHGKWRRANYTSPSGKSIFICEKCGRHSVTPDKNCPIGHSVNLTEALVLERIKFDGDGNAV